MERTDHDGRPCNEVRDSRGVTAQVLSGLKNPTSAFVLVLFFCGVIIGPTMALTCHLFESGYDSSDQLSSDYFALQFGFVLAVQAAALTLFDRLCYLVVRRRVPGALAESWMGVKGLVGWYLFYAACLFCASLFSYRLWFAEILLFRCIVLVSIVVAPFLLISRINRPSKERELSRSLGNATEVRDHAGSIVCFAVVSSAIIMSLNERLAPDASPLLVWVPLVLAVASGLTALVILGRRTREDCTALTRCAMKVGSSQVSLFMGIRVIMGCDGEEAPYFRATYAGQDVLVDIVRGCVLEGSIPSRQLKLVMAWTELHKDELMQDWELAVDNLPLNPIAPLR